MLPLLLALLVSQTPSPTGDDLPDPATAPAAPEWPDDTPAVILTPSAARCIAGGVDLGKGAWSSERLSGIINGRLEALAQYPARCQERLDLQERRCAEKIKRAIDVTTAKLGAADVREDVAEAALWTSWEVAGLTVGVGVVAMAAGFLAGHLK